MADFEKAFYTIPEAAELLRVHENTLYNLGVNFFAFHSYGGSAVSVRRGHFHGRLLLITHFLFLPSSAIRIHRGKFHFL